MALTVIWRPGHIALDYCTPPVQNDQDMAMELAWEIFHTEWQSPSS